MTTLREAAQEFIADYENGDLGDLKHYARALRAALAQEEQEPAIYPDEAREMGLEEVALYTHPPRRESQALTKEDVAQNLQSRYDAAKLLEERRQEITQPRREWRGLTEKEREQATGWSVEHIEAALKEKNNG